MNVGATISLYAPDFQSTKGYGLYVANTHLGYVDVGAAANDEIKFAFEKPNLHYYVVLGEPPNSYLPGI
jgi:alpha-glucosidase (family GH31 glycosyl hydrolase)